MQRGGFGEWTVSHSSKGGVVRRRWYRLPPEVRRQVIRLAAEGATYAQILALSGATDGALAELLKFQFTRIEALLLIIAILLAMGCFLDQVSMMLLTLPFIMPIMHAAHRVDSLFAMVITTASTMAPVLRLESPIAKSRRTTFRLSENTLQMT